MFPSLHACDSKSLTIDSRLFGQPELIRHSSEEKKLKILKLELSIIMTLLSSLDRHCYFLTFQFSAHSSMCPICSDFSDYNVQL